jgi:soluble lytic murein transglycosylase-like protein
VGWDVSVTQFLLAKDGAILPIDGHFGSRTGLALRKFQHVHELEADGIAGRRTFAALLKARPQHFVRLASRSEPADVPELIDYWAGHYGVDRTLMRALAWMESGYQANLRSSVGAQGVMQILPSAWSYVESVLLRDKVQHTVSGNIRVGVVLMRELLREFRSDARAALAAWYQGPTSVRQHGPFRVTKLFVADVIALRRRVA